MSRHYRNYGYQRTPRVLQVARTRYGLAPACSGYMVVYKCRASKSALIFFRVYS